MKRRVVLVGVMVLIFAVAAVMFASMTTRYTESVGIAIVSGESVMVVIDSNPIIISNQSFDDSLFEIVESGDKLKITHESTMDTSYPAQTGVYKLEIIEKDCADEIPAEVVGRLSELGWEI